MKETTAKRLKTIMEERNLKQSDLIRIIEPIAEKYGQKFYKSLLSMYLSGKTVPPTDKIFIMAEALGVSEIYLMGFDENNLSNNNADFSDATLDAKISNDKVLKESIKKYYNLSAEKQRQVIDFINFLSKGEN